jgi:hypothetical protein
MELLGIWNGCITKLLKSARKSRQINTVRV